jgi:hypothetical protein
VNADLAFRCRTDPFFALENIIRADSRDREGQVVPMRPMPAQAKFVQLTLKIRALNLAEQLVPGNPAHDGLEDAGLPKLPAGLRARFDAILEIGPDVFFVALEAAGLGEHITDGPVQIDVLKCRRGGLSSVIQALITLRANLKVTRAITMAQKGKNAELIFGYTRKFFKGWNPDLLELRQEATSMGENNAWANGSFARCFTAGGKDSGRSDQADVYHFSEAAFFPSFDEVKATLSAAPGHAWIFLETTANGMGGGFYSHYSQTLDFEAVLAAKERQWADDAETLAGWNGFYKFFFSWLEEPAYRKKLYDFERLHLLETLDETERVLVALHGAEPEQLQWRRDRIKKMGADANAVSSGLTPEQWFQQEFPANEEEAFQTSGKGVFSQSAINRCRVEAKGRDPRHFSLLPGRPIVQIRREHAQLRMWSKPKPGHLYTMGVDISKGVGGGDWTAMCVLDRLDGTKVEEAALWRGRWQPEELADTIAMLAEWYNGAFVVPELEGPAQATIHRLVRVLQYPNVFHRQSLDRVVDKAQDSGTWQYGWYPSPQVKFHAVYSLARALDLGIATFFSDVLLEELAAYQQVDRSLGAPEGKHDDCVAAAYLAYVGHTAVQNAPVDPGALAAAEELAARAVSRDSPDAAIWDYLRKIDAAEEKVLRKSKFYRDNGYLPDA